MRNYVFRNGLLASRIFIMQTKKYRLQKISGASGKDYMHLKQFALTQISKTGNANCEWKQI